MLRGEGARQVVAATSEAARRVGIEAGMRAADARALHPGLREWAWSPALYDEMQTELAAVLLAASPRVSSAGLGAFWLDAGGWDRRGGEEAFIEAACSALLAAGYPEARIGVADTAAAARAAAGMPDRAVHRVPPGDDAPFLRRLPLRALVISDELLELLGGLGLERVGDLATLEIGEVEARLGAEGARAHRQARGLDDGKSGPFGGAPPRDWSVEVELPGPVERLEPLLFILKSCLDHLSDALAMEGLCLAGLELTIETEAGPVRQGVRPARPTRQVSTLLSLCRGAFEGLRVPGRALGLRVELEGVTPAVAEQADLFEPPRPDPDAMANVLQRLQGRWGLGAVVRPEIIDSHRPERQGRWKPVSVMAELLNRGPDGDYGGGADDGDGVSNAGRSEDASGELGGSTMEGDVISPGGSAKGDGVAATGEGAGEGTGPRGAAPDADAAGESPEDDAGRLGLVLRLWPRPRALELRIEDGRPGAILLDEGWRAIRSFEGPERLSGDWWEDAYCREYYRVGTDRGDLVWVFYDPRRRSWFWHGWWD